VLVLVLEVVIVLDDRDIIIVVIVDFLPVCC
jgi:hypothetical protein